MSDQPSAPKQPSQSAGIRDTDALQIPERMLLDHGARVLDPVTAVRAQGQAHRLRPTVYVGDALLVPRDTWSVPRVRGLLDAAASQHGLRPVAEERTLRRGGLLDETNTPYAVRVRLEPLPYEPVEVDAWPVLVTIRNDAGRAGLAPAQVRGIGLNHLLAGGWPSMTGGPVVIPGGNWPALPSAPITDYGRPGGGARTPAAYLGRQPARNEKLDTRRPVVAILDTGAGRHPWLPDEIVTRGVDLDGEPAGHIDPLTDPDDRGDIFGPLDGVLDTHSGHGTFIAGLIRQLCPDADLLAIRIMQSDGIVDEDDLIWALTVLHTRLMRAQAGSDPKFHLDVVVLSLGYYHEALLDPASDHPVLHALLEGLGRAGVMVVAAAGNDATTRPMYPAAFTPHPGGYVSALDRDVVPLLSVGSLNPDASVALFSNSGPWVSAWDIGAAVVSTFPVTFDGSALSSAQLNDLYAQLPRRTIDPDGYGSINPRFYPGGFGTWSGTSFAAPVLAGRLTQQLLDGPMEDSSIPTLDQAGPAAAVHRAWAAVEAHSKLERP